MTSRRAIAAKNGESPDQLYDESAYAGGTFSPVRQSLHLQPNRSPKSRNKLQSQPFGSQSVRGSVRMKNDEPDGQLNMASIDSLDFMLEMQSMIKTKPTHVNMPSNFMASVLQTNSVISSAINATQSHDDLRNLIK